MPQTQALYYIGWVLALALIGKYIGTIARNVKHDPTMYAEVCFAGVILCGALIVGGLTISGLFLGFTPWVLPESCFCVVGFCFGRYPTINSLVSRSTLTGQS